jgi:hypothetical protein
MKAKREIIAIVLLSPSSNAWNSPIATTNPATSANIDPKYTVAYSLRFIRPEKLKQVRRKDIRASAGKA